MNTLGIHAGVWVGGWSAEEAAHAVSSTAAAGYDLIEVAGEPDRFDVARTRALLDQHGIQASMSLGLTRDRDVSSEDTAAVQRGERLLHSALEVVRGLGATQLVGVLYGALAKYDAPATHAGRANAVGVVRRLADDAARHGVSLGMEVVNRYETNLMNTARQALAFLDAVGRDNVGVHLDTYHMHIEEDDMARAVRDCGERLGYVHIGESHRGYLGAGNVAFTPFFRALAEAGYAGVVTFESFSSAVVDPALSGRLGVWRDFWDSSEDLAGHARAFMTGQLHAARRAV